MTHLSARLIVALTLLTLPASALSAPPPSVGGIRAVVESGVVRVSWNKPAADNIAYYRVFYSHASILGNDGLYDDFEVADGADTTHDLKNLPPADSLYVSVLAVNDKGEESGGFQEEATVALRGIASSKAATSKAAVSQAAAASAAAQTGNDKLRVLTATALTETGVLLTFSHPVTIDRTRAADAFVVRDASGTVLQLKRLMIDASKVILTTEPQTRNRVYEIRVGAAVTGLGSGGQTLPLDATQGPTLFSGSPLGVAPSPQTGGQTASQSATSQAAGGGEVRNLRLNATRGTGNSYMIEITWQPPVSGTVREYQVSQSLNGGKTYGAPQVVGKTAGGIKIQSVPGGTFGILVKTVYADGVTSKGVAQTLALPGGNALPGSVTTPGVTDGSTRPSNLPSSGLALPIVVAIAGGMSGTLFTRRKKAA
jgi:hypothetical protein